MEVLLSLFSLLLLALMVGALLGFVSFIRQKRVDERLRQAELEIAWLREELKTRSTRQQPITPSAVDKDESEDTTPSAADETTPAPLTTAADPWGIGSRPPQEQPQPVEPPGRSTTTGLVQHLRRHWMIWLGGTCVGLAGVFMVRYSIEQGLLGPGARILLSLLTGIGLHAAANWLRYRRGHSDVFAALAGGASIILYAALLASLHQLDYVPPGLVFAGMALVSFATLGLALLHGPLLAALGMLGGYLVPILVSTGSQQIEGALVYAFILSLSVLLLLRYVWRLWLWCGVVVGALAWWGLSFHTPPTAEVSRTLYLLGIAWGLLAMPTLDWLLSLKYRDDRSNVYPDLLRAAGSSEYAMLLALLLVIAAQSYTLFRDALDLTAVWSQLLLPLLLLHAAGRRPLLTPLPGLALIALGAALLAQFTSWQLFDVIIRPPSPVERNSLIALLALLSLLAIAYATWNLRARAPLPGIWASIGCLTPLLMLAIAYLLLAELHDEWRWGGAALAAGIAYLALARQATNRQTPALTLTLIASSHLAYSLAVVIWFQEATLTLALALQLISLAAIHQRFPQPLLPWLIRLVILAVGCRLILNPWVISYPSEVHWSLWTYGGSTLSCFIAARISRRSPPLQAWLQGAAATLLVLTLGTELRYWLYNGEIFNRHYGFTEAAINTLVWGAASLVYHWRASLSQYVARLYRTLAALLLTMSLTNHLFVVVLIDNPLWGQTPIASTPVWNLLLLAYGAPTLLLLAIARYYRLGFRPWATLGCGLNLLLFVSLEIRHLWQGALDIALPTENPELYTYSATWLLLAAVGMGWAIRRERHRLYQGAMTLLVLVIVKIFLIDMQGLDGLLRVASFMGLGLVLLLLAWLHQQLRPHTDNA
ncbi:DUF2339 domain-containing protein [Marinobacterium sp. D7]|uniref:DUF2339 domain-containing protein n=1 Tax=Marinobacterium ramblicola TaxID=2849041 RepID=UPI001C2DA8AB|nr:DUF2339 domain-containing protein [Marinobacterium ramblicola]MBV1789789.1 DUF2339 domain-containing protein [Marinobacterium ramblicola]